MATLRDITTTCIERNEQAGLNTFEEGSADPLPACGSDCDIYSQVRRGAITKAFNLGLTFPQSKPLNVDTYNQGCLDPWGCVNNEGFTCRGAASGFSPFMDERLRDLNLPLDPTRLEYHPPRYMMGIKDNSVNSVTGWQKDAAGRARWTQGLVPMPCHK